MNSTKVKEWLKEKQNLRLVPKGHYQNARFPLAWISMCRTFHTMRTKGNKCIFYIFNTITKTRQANVLHLGICTV